MNAREEFHFYLCLVTGLCQYQDRDENLLQLLLEQLGSRARQLKAMHDLTTTDEERDNTQATDTHYRGFRM